jgi:DNA phosphorothioation-dependent restriction protein DptF
MIKAIVKSKGIVSMRSVLNFVYDIIIPPKFQVDTENIFRQLVKNLSPEEYFQNLLPNYLFEHSDLSNLFSIISQEDPCNRRSEVVDDSVIKIINTNKIQDFAREEYVERLNKGKMYESLSKIQFDKALISKTHIRLLYFSNSVKYCLNDVNYQEYISYLYHSNKGNKKEIRNLYNLVIHACERWNGNPNESKSTIVEIGKKQKKYRILQEFKPEPYLGNFNVKEESLLRRFYPQLKVDFKSKEGELITLHIDTGLFNLLNKVNHGYRPNKLDKNSYINFINFLNHLVEVESQMLKLKIDEVNIGKNIDYVFSTDAFGEYTFEKV